ncbi:MAG TPA: hypothetical protein VG963_08930 [Polyangiaceae bacterium]|nr:hypothetical protein [Polyangiaceae bacterium]
MGPYVHAVAVRIFRHVSLLRTRSACHKSSRENRPARRLVGFGGSSVNGLRRWMTACLAAVGLVLVSGSVAAEDLSLPAGSRIGIIVMMSTDVTHYHVGKVPQGSFMRTYRVPWPIAEIVDDPLAQEIKKAGFEPVVLDPPDQLRRQVRPWFISTSQATRLPNAAMEEIERIITAESLKALVIVAPGPNANPESVAGNRLRRLPVYVQGWGFSTSDEPDGVAKPVVFNLVQMLLFGQDGNDVEFAFREWGGGFVYEWANFDPGADLKTLPAEEIDKFRPVISDVLQRQVGRLMPHIKVAG